MGFDFAFSKEDENGFDDDNIGDYTGDTIGSDDDDEEDVQAVFGDCEESAEQSNRRKRENFERKETVGEILYEII